MCRRPPRRHAPPGLVRPTRYSSEPSASTRRSSASGRCTVMRSAPGDGRTASPRSRSDSYTSCERLCGTQRKFVYDGSGSTSAEARRRPGAGSTGSRSGASGLEARTRQSMVPAPAGVRFAPGRPRAHRGVEPRGLAHALAPFRGRARRGPRMPWPVPSRATKPRPERFAISSACWHRPWKHRKCSRLNDSSNLRASYAISRRNCVRIEGSPHRTSSRSATSNVNWRRTSGVVVTTPNHARCSWTPGVVWKGGGAAPIDPDVEQAYARGL